MDSFEKNGLHFNVLNNKKKTVSVRMIVGKGITGALSIPETVEYEGKVYTITEIDGTAVPYEVTILERINDKRLKLGFKYENKTEKRFAYGFNGTEITSVKFPKTIEKIGRSAFSRCKKLEKVDLSSTSLVEIGENAFYSCVELKKVILPNTVKKIDGYAFDGCTSLKEINIPTSLKVIAHGTFSSCESLKKIEIPASVDVIEKYAFTTENDKLNVTIDNSDDNLVIEKGAFDDTAKITYKGKSLLNKIFGK